MLASLLGILLQASTPAATDDLGFVTAGALADRCGSDAATDISYCFAYVAGVHDTMRAYEIWLGQREFCAQSGLAQGDLRRAFLSYISAYPDMREGQAASVVAIALKSNFPCEGAPSDQQNQMTPPAMSNPVPVE